MSDLLYDKWREFYLQQLAAGEISTETRQYDLEQMWLSTQLNSKVINVTEGQSVQAAIDAASGERIIHGITLRSENTPYAPSAGRALVLEVHNSSHETTDRAVLEWTPTGAATISDPNIVTFSTTGYGISWHVECSNNINLMLRDLGNSTVAPVHPQQWFEYPEWEVCVFAIQDHHLHISPYPGYAMHQYRVIDVTRDSTDWIDIQLGPGNYAGNIVLPNHVRLRGSSSAIIQGQVVVSDNCAVDGITIDASDEDTFTCVHLTPVARQTENIIVQNCTLVSAQYGVAGPWYTFDMAADGFVPSVLKNARFLNNRITASQPFWIQSSMQYCHFLHNTCTYDGDSELCFALFDAPVCAVNTFANEWGYNTFTGTNTSAPPYGFVLAGHSNSVHHNTIDLSHPVAAHIYCVRYSLDLPLMDDSPGANHISHNTFRFDHDGIASPNPEIKPEIYGVYYSYDTDAQHPLLVMEQNTFVINSTKYGSGAKRIAIGGSAKPGTRIVVGSAGLAGIDNGSCDAAGVSRSGISGTPIDWSRIVFHNIAQYNVTAELDGMVVVLIKDQTALLEPQLVLPPASSDLVGLCFWFMIATANNTYTIYSENGQMRFGDDSNLTMIDYAGVAPQYSIGRIECISDTEWLVTDVTETGLAVVF